MENKTEQQVKSREALSEYLIQRISYCMQTAMETGANDSIQFLGTHLPHLRQENSSSVFEEVQFIFGPYICLISF